jgi:hypothetical protein
MSAGIVTKRAGRGHPLTLPAQAGWAPPSPQGEGNGAGRSFASPWGEVEIAQRFRVRGQSDV